MYLRSLPLFHSLHRIMCVLLCANFFSLARVVFQLRASRSWTSAVARWLISSTRRAARSSSSALSVKCRILPPTSPGSTASECSITTPPAVASGEYLHPKKKQSNANHVRHVTTLELAVEQKIKESRRKMTFGCLRLSTLDWVKTLTGLYFISFYHYIPVKRYIDVNYILHLTGEIYCNKLFN